MCLHGLQVMRDEPEARGVDPDTSGTRAAGAADAVASLVYATFIGREKEWTDQETGEINKPPITVNSYTFPDGGGEITAVKSGKPKNNKIVNSDEWNQYIQDRREFGPEKATELAHERQVARQERSKTEAARRAKTKVRRICRTHQLKYMVTLTFPGDGVHDYDRALRLVQDFIHDHGNLLGRGGIWLATPELHPSGHGWHWHVLVAKRFTKSELESLRVGWTQYLRRHSMEPSGGARFVRIDVKQWGNASQAAGYAAKYVGKTFEDGQLGKYRKRYLVSRGVNIECNKGGANTLAEVEKVLDQIEGIHVYKSSDDSDRDGPPMVWGSW